MKPMLFAVPQSVIQRYVIQDSSWQQCHTIQAKNVTNLSHLCQSRSTQFSWWYF